MSYYADNRRYKQLMLSKFSKYKCIDKQIIYIVSSTETNHLISFDEL